MSARSDRTVVSVPAALIAAACLFVPKKDVRYYLEGVHIKVEGAQGFISATDGHTGLLARFDVDDGETSPFEAIIPAKVLTGSAKGDVNIELEGTRVTVWRGDQGRISKTIDFANFPSLRTIMPAIASGKPANFQSHYLVRAQRVAKLLDSESTPLQHNGDGAGVMVFDRAVVVIMPITRMQALPIPAWATSGRSPAPANTEAAAA